MSTYESDNRSESLSCGDADELAAQERWIARTELKVWERETLAAAVVTETADGSTSYTPASTWPGCMCTDGGQCGACWERENELYNRYDRIGQPRPE